MSYLEPKIRYMNSVSGSSAGNLPDAEQAYWTTLETSGPPAGEVAFADITGVPAALTAAQAAATPSIRAIGTTATTAAAGNHTHTATVVTATAIAPGTATNVQGILAELAARIAALEAV